MRIGVTNLYEVWTRPIAAACCESHSVSLGHVPLMDHNVEIVRATQTRNPDALTAPAFDDAGLGALKRQDK